MEPFDIEMYGFKIEYVNRYKMLGILLDKKLKFKNQLKQVYSKLNSLVPIFYSIKNYIPYSVKRSIYNSLCLSQVSYCDIILIFYTRKFLHLLYSILFVNKFLLFG